MQMLLARDEHAHLLPLLAHDGAVPAGGPVWPSVDQRLEEHGDLWGHSSVLDVA